MKIKIIIAAHKNYQIPNDSMYLPVHVGHAIAKEKFGWQGDDTGDNISHKNPFYCELTALYWAWKNLDADAIGLVHYRRYFINPNLYKIQKLCSNVGLIKKNEIFNFILHKKEAEKILDKYPIIVPTKRHYFIETIETQYMHAHQKQDLNIVRRTIAKKSNFYLDAFDRHMNERSSHIYNMFIMRKNYFDDYCKWLFCILFEVEKNLHITNCSKNNARVLGYLGERLLDVWLNANNIKYYENKILYLERQNLIKKGLFFIYRKFFSNQKK